MNRLFISLTLFLLITINCYSQCTGLCIVAASNGELSDPASVVVTLGNTTPSSGAGALIIVTSTQNGVTDWSLTDNKGNTFQHITPPAYDTNAQNVQLHYCVSGCVFGAGHTITLNGGSSASTPTVSAMAINGTYNFDTPNQNSNGGTSGGVSMSTGSVTPSAVNSVIVAGVGFYAFNSVTGVDSGFTLATFNASSTGLFETGLAYLAETSPSAVNPTFTSASGSTFAAGVIASFKPVVAPTGRIKHRVTN